SDIINGIKYGVSYFSILPVKLYSFKTNSNFYKGVLFSLPIVGLVLSLLTIALFIILPMQNIYKAILVSILYLFLYGFIHLEAVADTIDGYFASLSNKDVHSIMKEPQIGAIGAIGTFCFILLKILALSYLLFQEQYFMIIFVLIASRGSIFFAIELEYHKDSSFINSLKNSITIHFIFRLLFLPFNILTKFILKKVKKAIGFLNGDTLGFNIELQEIILLNIGVLLC
ncbi:MAG: adenosylcobinamide-GDP ribazoletransferase, partial [Campylobacterota bacterium]|nr:adenosylcobinamide-GDP ribazoletransferase [Campylobacterota bacterium]